MADGDPSSTRESFLLRWSRRKRAVRRSEGEERAPQPPAEDGQSPDQHTEAAEAAPSERAQAELPDPETLDEHSDYSAFLSSEVSEALRRRALRRLFMSAKYNVVDGLDDYAEDYRSFEALGGIITSDMRFQMEREAERARERAAAPRSAEGQAAEAREAGVEPEEADENASAQAPEERHVLAEEPGTSERGAHGERGTNGDDPSSA